MFRCVVCNKLATDNTFLIDDKGSPFYWIDPKFNKKVTNIVFLCSPQCSAISRDKPEILEI
jgi:hypothetical protein